MGWLAATGLGVGISYPVMFGLLFALQVIPAIASAAPQVSAWLWFSATGMVGGTIAGVCQWRLLRHASRYAWLWMIGATLGWLAAAEVCRAFGEMMAGFASLD